MQPDAQMMGQVAPAGQQIIVVQNKSGGPKVFGIIAIILGVLGVGGGLMGIGNWDGALWIVTGILDIASAGLFAYAGFLLFQYQKKGVWMGFAAVGVTVLSGLLFWLVVAADVSDGTDAGDAAGGFIAGLGMIIVGIQAVCCSACVALPLMMNGADLD